VGEVSPRELAERLERGEVDLVDVREPYEWEAGRIAGARHIPLAELTARAAEIERERPVVFYCRVGARSAMATEAFAGAGYDAANLSGGIVGWDEAGLPLEPEGAGRVAEH
jgi:rhodanese-related sulfurtransferase